MSDAPSLNIVIARGSEAIQGNTWDVSLSIASSGSPLLADDGRVRRFRMPFRPASSALSDLLVLDLTRVRSGPTCVRQFADWGANVIKIDAREEGGSDGGRPVGFRDAPRSRFPESPSQQARDGARPEEPGRHGDFQEDGREGRYRGRELSPRCEEPARHRLRIAEGDQQAHHPRVDLGLRPGRALQGAARRRSDRPGHVGPDVDHRRGRPRPDARRHRRRRCRGRHVRRGRHPHRAA